MNLSKPILLLLAKCYLLVLRLLLFLTKNKLNPNLTHKKDFLKNNKLKRKQPELVLLLKKNNVPFGKPTIKPQRLLGIFLLNLSSFFIYI